MQLIFFTPAGKAVAILAIIGGTAAVFGTAAAISGPCSVSICIRLGSVPAPVTITMAAVTSDSFQQMVL